MTEFFEAFNPGQRFWREQQQLEKTLFVDQHKAGSGPKPLDLESGVVKLVMPVKRTNPETPDAAEATPRADSAPDRPDASHPDAEPTDDPPPTDQ